MFTLPVALAFLAVPTAPAVRASVSNAVPTLVAAAVGHAERKTCFACHNQGVPAVAFALARDRGFPVEPGLFADQAEHIVEFLTRNRDGLIAGRNIGGAADTVGYALLTLDQLGHPGDANTAAAVEYLLLHQADRSQYRTTSRRPPTEASDFTVNYLAARGLRRWATADQTDRAGRRVADVRIWLLRATPTDTEDRVFRLLGLAETDAPIESVRTATAELLATQRADGGWGQLPGMASDPYATGSALYALHTAGRLPTADPRYQRGVGFLLRTQLADGTWHVKTRSNPFQPYYESGFPHEKDQFISAAASGWATAALALACEPVSSGRSASR